MRILDGKKLQDDIKEELREELLELVKKTEKQPKLAIIQVGDDPASNTYIKQKIKHAIEVGITPTHIQLKKNEPESKIIETIQALNHDNLINGIIVQLPLPKNLDEFKVIEAINPVKDVDCLTSTNIGLLHIQKPYMTPCTPSGVIEILKRYNIKTEGQNALVIGRSNIVGRPLAEMLTQENATVTLAHSKTKFIKEDLDMYDIIISAVGKANFIRAEDLTADEFYCELMVGLDEVEDEDVRDIIRRKITVIDVGINRDEDGKLCGDVDYKAVIEDEESLVANITPVPSGVGRLTVAMLLKNVVKAFKKQNNIL